MALPSTERGPVDFCALRRFASICWMVAIKRKGQASPERGSACPAHRVAGGVSGGGGLVRVSD
jgi:hypothetical protein